MSVYPSSFGVTDKDGYLSVTAFIWSIIFIINNQPHGRIGVVIGVLFCAVGVGSESAQFVNSVPNDL